MPARGARLCAAIRCGDPADGPGARPGPVRHPPSSCRRRGCATEALGPDRSGSLPPVHSGPRALSGGRGPAPSVRPNILTTATLPFRGCWRPWHCRARDGFMAYATPWRTGGSRAASTPTRVATVRPRECGVHVPGVCLRPSEPVGGRGGAGGSGPARRRNGVSTSAEKTAIPEHSINGEGPWTPYCEVIPLHIEAVRGPAAGDFKPGGRPLVGGGLDSPTLPAIMARRGLRGQGNAFLVPEAAAPRATFL